MIANWTAEGEETVALGDDSAKHTIELQQFGGASVTQVEGLFRGAAVEQFARGNVSGRCVFVASKSHADREAALTYLAQEYGRLNQKGTLELRQGTLTLTLADAQLNGVEMVQCVGVRVGIRYSFGITTVEAST